MDNYNLIKIAKAIADETRLQIIEVLKNNKYCGYVILSKLKISQPTLSHHMKVLCESGLVISERDWKWVYYKLNDEAFIAFSNFIKSLK